MGNATGRALHIDTALSNMALGYRPSGFIADMVFPIVPVQKQSDFYYEFLRSERARIENDLRAPGTEANIITESVGSGTFFAKNYALKRRIPMEDRANADPVLLAGLINGGATFVMNKLLLSYERRIARLVNSTSNVGSSAAVSSAWNGAGNPIGNINTAIDNVQNSTGQRPNRIIFGLDAWKSFRRDANVRDLIFGNNNGGGYPSVAQAADLFEVEHIMVGGAYENTAQEGLAESLATIWKDNVLVYYAPHSPQIDAPSFGYSFRWAPAGMPSMQAERHPFDTKTKAEEVEIGYYQDEKITGAAYGFLLTAVNSST